MASFILFDGDRLYIACFFSFKKAITEKIRSYIVHRNVDKTLYRGRERELVEINSSTAKRFLKNFPEMFLSIWLFILP